MTEVEMCKRYVNKAENAAERGIPFELSFKRFKQLMLQKRCFYLNEPFAHGIKARSLDRKDNTLGYTDSNTVACFKYINNHKGNLSIMEILKIAQKLKPLKNKRNEKADNFAVPVASKGTDSDSRAEMLNDGAN